MDRFEKLNFSNPKSILLNYYIENDHINLNNNISQENLIILIHYIKQFNIIINVINIPNNFKYNDIINHNFSNIKICFFNSKN